MLCSMPAGLALVAQRLILIIARAPFGLGKLNGM